MLNSTLPAAFARLDSFEVRLCLPVNSAGRYPLVRAYFAVVSRLGDGVAWYSLAAIVLFIFRSAAFVPVVHMLLTGLFGLAIYKVLKRHLVRERPFHSHQGVCALVVPLDRYSFPSGHTLHAATFAVMFSHYFPALMWLVVPFAVSVGVSRVVLGLHYPSDVLAGALIGWTLATVSLALV